MSRAALRPATPGPSSPSIGASCKRCSATPWSNAWEPMLCTSGSRLVRVGGSDERPVAEFETGRSQPTSSIAADGIHSAARAQRYPDEGAFLWNGSLLWRGIAEVDPVLDGRSMIWAGHPDQKFVGYPIADLPGGRQRFNFIAEMRRPRSDLARRRGLEPPGSLDDFLPQFKEWDFGWLDVPAIVETAPETFLFPDGGSGARFRGGPSAGRHCWGTPRIRCTPSARTAPPRPFWMPACWPVASAGTSDDLDEALQRYEETRRPATAAIVAGQPRPRARAPDAARGGSGRPTASSTWPT